MDLTVESGPHPSTKQEEPDNPLPITPMATIHDDDELLLARIGYKQVFPPETVM